MSPLPKKTGEQGFTLIEVLLSLVMLGMITLAAAELLSMGARSAERVTVRQEMIAQARYGIERMTNEILKLKSSDITTIAADRLDFNDSSGTATNFRVATVSGVTQVMRGNDLLIPNANALSFTYLDKDGNATATIANIRQIQWQVTIPEAKWGNYTLRTNAFLRSTYYANFR